VGFSTDSVWSSVGEAGRKTVLAARLAWHPSLVVFERLAVGAQKGRYKLYLLHEVWALIMNHLK
jgi:hypothetical protein